MAVASGTVRVFISSTFRDMHAERDHLVTVVFPELRERCEQLGLEFFDVDLRWGVPEKGPDGEKANSWEYCRQWIDRVEPFFVCILGQRYGWVPRPEELKAREDRRRQQAEQRSITDMEVHHAVLNTMLKRRSYFYLRVTHAPATAREYVDLPPLSHKLKQLKEEVRSCGRPVRDYPCTWTGCGFIGLEEFGRCVLDDLWSGVLRDERYVSKEIWRQVLGADPDTDACYTAESAPIPPDLAAKLVTLARPAPLSPLDAEKQQMEAFAQARLRWFQGRTEELKQLVGFINATGDETTRLAVVVAEPGQGKSALLAKLAAWIPQPSTFLIAHFVGATERSASAHALIERLLGELDRSGIEWPAQDRKEGRDFDGLCRQLTRRLAEYAGERRIVILLDAVNQLSDGHDLAWLPHRLGSSVRVVVSCVEDGSQQRVLHALDSRQLGYLSVSLGPLTANDVRTIVSAYLQEYCKELDVPHVNAICSMSQARNPLYLLVMLGELRTLGGDRMNETVGELIRSMPQNHRDTVSLFRWVLRRLEVFGPEPVRLWCLYLAHGRVGMASHELAELLARRLGANAAATALRIERGLRRYLQRRGPQLDFLHSQLRQAVFERYGPQAQAIGVHVDLALFFRNRADPTADGRWRGNAPRGLSEAPFHQTQAGLWGELRETLCNVRFIEAKCAAGMGYALTLDYIAAVAAIPKPEEEVLEEQYCRRQLEKYFVELVAYSRHPESAPRPQPVQSIAPGSHCSTCLAQASGLPLRGLRAFQQFVHSQVQHLAEFSYLPGFVRQQAFNFESEGHVGRAAEIAFNVEGEEPCLWFRLRNRRAATEFPACLKSLLAHPMGIVAAALSSDGQRAMTVGRDHTIRRWDIRSGRCEQTLQMDYHDLTSIAMTHNADTAVVGDSFGHVYVIDSASGVVKTMAEQDSRRVQSVALAANGHLAASVSADGQVRVWDVRTAHCVRSFNAHDGSAQTIAMAVDGSLIVTGGGDGSISVWATESGECLRTLAEHPHGVRTLALSHDGSLIVSAGTDVIRVWLSVDGVLLNKLVAGNQAVNSLDLTPDKLYLVTGGHDQHVRVWQLNTGECVRDFIGHTGEIHAVAITPDARMAVSASEDGTLRVWDVTRGPALTSSPFHRAPVFAVAIREDGTAVSAAYDQSVGFWDPRRGECRLRRNSPRETPDLVALAGDGRVALVRRENDLQVWDLDKDRITAELQERTAPVGYVALSWNGRVALTTHGDEMVQLWDTQTGRPIGRCHAQGAAIDCGTLSADGAHVFLAESFSGGLWHWGVRAHKCVRLVADSGQVIRDLVCSVGGRYLITCSVSDICIWGTEEGRCIRKWTVESHIPSALCLVREGHYLLSGGRDHTLRVWSLPDGRLQHVVAAGEGTVRSMAIADELVVLGTANGSVLFYDWTTARPLV